MYLFVIYDVNCWPSFTVSHLYECRKTKKKRTNLFGFWNKWRFDVGKKVEMISTFTIWWGWFLFILIVEHFNLVRSWISFVRLRSISSTCGGWTWRTTGCNAGWSSCWWAGHCGRWREICGCTWHFIHTHSKFVHYEYFGNKTVEFCLEFHVLTLPVGIYLETNAFVMFFSFLEFRGQSNNYMAEILHWTKTQSFLFFLN